MSTHHETKQLVLLGVDGGGTRCRARLADAAGKTLGESVAGPANPRHGLQETLSAIHEATDQCLRNADFALGDCRIVACLALAGVSESKSHAQVQASRLAFHRLVLTSDARAACFGAHAGHDGGIIIVGTGSVGWGRVVHKEHRVGGWGFPVSDEGSGASLGCEALRRVLWAHDGLIPWTNLLLTLFEKFGRESCGIVHWMSNARPRDFATLAPTIVKHAQQGDAIACGLMQSAAAHIDMVAARLCTLGVPRLSLMGGLADSILPFLSHQTRSGLVAAKGDALDGALRLACAEAASVGLMEPVRNA